MPYSRDRYCFFGSLMESILRERPSHLTPTYVHVPKYVTGNITDADAPVFELTLQKAMENEINTVETGR